MIVSKCCCCISLKYGYLTYGTIFLMLRVCAATSLLFNAIAFFHHEPSVTTTLGPLFGWTVGSAVALYVALRGISTKRAVLIYPYIVVLILEIIVGIIVAIIGAITSSIWFLLELFIVGGINIYAAICLISLYQDIKAKEKAQQTFERVPLKSV